MTSPLSVDLARATERLDLARRLAAIPAGACIRGVFFHVLRDALARRHLLHVPDIARLLAKAPRTYGYYPARDCCELYGIAGALVSADPLEGIRQLFVGTVDHYCSTWYGRAFTRFLRPDPRSALEWIERSREYMANYGRWRLEMRSAQHAVFHMFDEYFWIEGHRGGCEGLLKACGVPGSVHAELDDPFHGRLDIRWELRN